MGSASGRFFGDAIHLRAAPRIYGQVAGTGHDVQVTAVPLLLFTRLPVQPAALNPPANDATWHGQSFGLPLNDAGPAAPSETSAWSGMRVLFVVSIDKAPSVRCTAPVAPISCSNRLPPSIRSVPATLWSDAQRAAEIEQAKELWLITRSPPTDERS